MRSFLNKVWSTFAVAVLSASAMNAGVAAYPYYGDNCDSCCAPQPEPCYGYAYNPGVFVTDCCGWYANIEYLYWKPNQEGVSVGTVSQFSQLDSGKAFDFVGSISSTYKYPKFEWDSGFRIGVGYNLPCDSWSVGLNYTHYRTDNDARASSALSFNDSGSPIALGTVFGPAYSIYTDPDNIDRFLETQVVVDTSWKIQFNQLDLDFGREFYVARSMTLRPHIGLRALFINQSFDVGTTAFFGDASDNVTEIVSMDNDFKGCGLQGGLDMGFELMCNLGFYGEIGGGATFGKARTTQRDNASFSVTASATDTFQTNFHAQDNHDLLLVNADLAFGIRWRQKVNCDQNLLTVKFGWEEHIFFGYNRFRNLSTPNTQSISSNSPTGNLDFYGIVLALAFDF